MQNRYLFYSLLGVTNNSPLYKETFISPGDAGEYNFLVKGYAMEYISVDKHKKIVSLFFGPKEWIVQCHPVYSNVIMLTDVKMDTLQHQNIVELLKGFAESREIYRQLRNVYWEEVAERIMIMKTRTHQQRFDHLCKKQPWILELADEEDIASYLQISVKMLRGMRKRG